MSMMAPNITGACQPSRAPTSNTARASAKSSGARGIGGTTCDSVINQGGTSISSKPGPNAGQLRNHGRIRIQYQPTIVIIAPNNAKIRSNGGVASSASAAIDSATMVVNALIIQRIAVSGLCLRAALGNEIAALRVNGVTGGTVGVVGIVDIGGTAGGHDEGAAVCGDIGLNVGACDGWSPRAGTGYPYGMIGAVREDVGTAVGGDAARAASRIHTAAVSISIARYTPNPTATFGVCDVSKSPSANAVSSIDVSVSAIMRSGIRASRGTRQSTAASATRQTPANASVP